MSENDDIQAKRRILLAFYHDHDRAESALRRLMDADFAPDRISLLGKASSSGDDPLGVYYSSAGERMKAWGGMGAFWGGLWGLLSGAAGFFLVPGVGAVAAAGPVVNAVTGAAAGAGVAGGAMVGGAALSQLGVAIHGMGVPEDTLEEVRRRLDQGQTLLMLITGAEEASHWHGFVEDTDADALWEFPYTGYTDAARQAVSG